MSGSKGVSVALIDPPMLRPGTPRPWTRFEFSEIAWSLAREWNRVHASCEHLDIYSSYDVAPEFPNVGVHHVRAPRRLLRNSVLQLPVYTALGRAVERGGHNIIHGVDYYSLAVASRFTRAVPVVTTPGNIHERIATGYPLDSVVNRVLKASLVILRRRGAWIHATSEYMADWWISSGFDPSRVTVIPVPTLPGSASISQRDALSDLGWSPENLNILVVAAPRRENLLHLVERFSEAVEDIQNKSQYRRYDAVHIHMVGPDSEPNAYSMAPAKDTPVSVQTSYYGRVDPARLATFYRAADALLVPRRFNATPRVAIEALRSGTPVITNLAPSLRGSPYEGPYVFELDLLTCGREAGHSEPIASVLESLAELRGQHAEIEGWAEQRLGSLTVARQVRDMYWNVADSLHRRDIADIP